MRKFEFRKNGIFDNILYFLLNIIIKGTSFETNIYDILWEFLKILSVVFVFVHNFFYDHSRFSKHIKYTSYVILNAMVFTNRNYLSEGFNKLLDLLTFFSIYTSIKPKLNK